jgi:hypothetical protein
MAGFGSMFPQGGDPMGPPEQYESWQDREARAALPYLLEAEAAKKAAGKSWYETINDVAHFPHRVFGALAQPSAAPPAAPPQPGDRIAQARAVMSQPGIQNIPGNLVHSVGEAIYSGATAPGEALSGELPMTDASGNTSPEAIRRGFDLASIAGGGSVAGTAERLARAPGRDMRLFGRKIGGETPEVPAAVPSAAAAPYYGMLEGAPPPPPAAAEPAAAAPTRIPIQDIEYGEGAAPGGSLSRPEARSTIEEYAKRPTEFPPVEVFPPDQPGGKYLMYDGHYRTEAAKLRGDTHIPATLLSDSAKPGSAIAGIGHLDEAVSHGLPTASHAAENPVHLRIGTWNPKYPNSKNYAKGDIESGLSVYEIDKNGKPIVPPEGEWAADDLSSRMKGSEPKFLVQGDVSGWGHDGEPLLINPRVVGKYLASDSAKPGAVIATAEHAPAFSTSAEPALAASARKAGTGEQWLNELKRYGAKPEELDWRGVTDLLTKAKEPIARADLEQHLAQSPVGIKTVEKKAAPQWEELTPEQKDYFSELYQNSHDDHTPRNPNWDGVQRLYQEYRRESPDVVTGNPTRYEDYQIPGGTNYRERLLTLPPKGSPIGQEPSSGLGRPNRQIYSDPTYHGPHWDEPNVIVHRRTTDREMPGEGFTVTNTRSGNSSQVFATEAEARAYQAKLPASVQTEIRPAERKIKTLHDEENQSDLHQDGAKRGYGDPEIVREGDRWKAIANGQEIAHGRLEDFKNDREIIDTLKGRTVPDLPFKTSWSKLALHDQIREAAEKGFDRISWTGGKSQPTNPKNLGGGGKTAEELDKIERGLVQHYDVRRVNEANKIGKEHGVEVQKSTVPGHEGYWGDGPNEPVFHPQKQHDIYHMDIPQSLKDQALKKGFSLFEDSAAGEGIAAASHVPTRAPEEMRGLSFPAEESADRLRMKLAREQKAADRGTELPGAPANERTTVRAPEGPQRALGGRPLPDFVAGKVTPEDWVSRHEQILTPDEIHGAAKWYDEIFGQFMQHTHGDAEKATKYMRAWLVGQQNIDVSGAMQNMLLQREQILRGVPESEMKAGGMPNPTVAARRVMQGQPITEGVGQKISDFVDAAEGKNVRSWMGNKPEGGEPFVVDVHTARDTGMVDQELINHLTRLGYDKDQLAQLKTDLGTSPSSPQYENRVKFGKELTNYLNERNWQGRSDWKPKEVQAIGWMGMTRLTANKADDIVTGLRSSMRHLSMELAPGEGSPWAAKYGKRFEALPPAKQRELTHAISQEAVKRASQIAGVDVRDIVHGTGGWQTFQNPSTVAQTFSSKSGAEIAANALGHLLQQTEVWSNKVKPLTSNPKGFAVDLIADGKHDLGTDKGLRDFWGKIMAADPTAGSKNPLFQGYQPIKMPDGRVGIRVLIDRGGETTKTAIENAISGPIKSVVEKLPHDVEIRRHEAEIYKARNDWKEHPNGEGYRQRLVDLIGPDRAASLDSHGAQLEGLFNRSLKAAEAGTGKVKKPAAPKKPGGFGSIAPGAP